MSLADWKVRSLPILAILFTSSFLSAQDAPKKKAADGPSGRLPAYYKDVVDETQKKKIYEIQSKYKTKIDVLAEEVKTLQAQRDKEIEALLSPEQKTKLSNVKAEADKKKAAAAAALKANTAAKPATSTTPAPAPTSTPSTTTTPATVVPAPGTVPAVPRPTTTVPVK